MAADGVEARRALARAACVFWHGSGLAGLAMSANPVKLVVGCSAEGGTAGECGAIADGVR